MTPDEISPATIGEDRIDVTPDPATQPHQVGKPVAVLIDYSRTAPEGVVLPLEVVVQPANAPDGRGYVRKVYRRSRPTGFSWTPLGAGSHLVLVKEVGHNRWQGRLLIDVEGDPFQQVFLSDR